MQTNWLPGTKFKPPPLRSDLVPRKRLLALASQALRTNPVVLVTAPAGYGKTSLLSALAREPSEMKFAWLALDEEDNDPARLLGGLSAALAQLDGRCGTATRSILAEPGAQTLPARRLAGVLINEILDLLPDAFALILDDAHLLQNGQAHEALSYLLERRPEQMRLVISGRSEPPFNLARLRARGEVADISSRELRFTAEETEIFLNRHNNLALSPQELGQLTERTEGWAAGLRLVATSLARIAASADRATYIADLAGRDRRVFEFLTSEVLARQEPDVQRFLLQTSILDELTPALAGAVTGRADAAEVLDDLSRRDVFLLPLDEAGSAYRYHQVFAEFLRHRLAAERHAPAELHRRAAAAESTPARAVRHYLAAESWIEAAQAIIAAGPEMLRQGLLATLEGWIRALPPPVWESEARLVYWLGICAVQRGAFDQAEPLLRQARADFAAASDARGEGECLVQLASIVSGRFDFAASAPLIEAALSKPIVGVARIQLLIVRTWHGFYQDDWEQADRDLDSALALALTSSDPAALHAPALTTRGILALLPGGPDRLVRYAEAALAREDRELSPLKASAYDLLGYVHFLRGRPAEATAALEKALAISVQLGGFPWMDLELHVALSMLALARGDHAAVAGYVQGRQEQLRAVPAVRPFLAIAGYVQARDALARRRVDEARRIQEELAADEAVRRLPLASVAQWMLAGLIESAEGRYAAAEGSLRHAATIARRVRATRVFCDPQLSLAQLYLRWGRGAEALHELEPALQLWEQADMPGAVLREGPGIAPLLQFAVQRNVHAPFAARLLEILNPAPRNESVTVPQTGETLSPREVEVLRLIAAGAANKEVAERLVISERTVKTHIYNLFRKLDVSSRTQAAARARELNLA